jgi:hypothetical protein
MLQISLFGVSFNNIGHVFFVFAQFRGSFLSLMNAKAAKGEFSCFINVVAIFFGTEWYRPSLNERTI